MHNSPRSQEKSESKATVFTRENLRRSVLPMTLILVGSLVLGFIFIKTVGPLTLPDPETHAYEAYALATGQAFNPSIPYTDEAGNQMTAQYADIDSRIVNAPRYNNTLRHIVLLPDSHDDYMDAEIAALSQKDYLGTTNVVRRSQYHPLAYALQGTAVWISIVIGRTPMQALTLARFFNLFVTILLELLAILIMPRGKTLLAVIATLPCVVFLAASISLDATVTALTMLVVASVACAIERGNMTPSLAFICAGSCVALFLIKVVYAVVALLPILLPGHILPIRRKILVCVLAGIVSLSIYLPWHMLVSFTYAWVNTGDTVAYIVQHPLTSIMRVANSLASLPLYIAELPLRYRFNLALVILILVVTYRRYTPLLPPPDGPTGNSITRWRMPIGGFFCFLVAMSGIYWMLLITWNAPDVWTARLIGFQERYLIPCLPLFALLLYPIRTTDAIDNN